MGWELPRWQGSEMAESQHKVGQAKGDVAKWTDRFRWIEPRSTEEASEPAEGVNKC